MLKALGAFLCALMALAQPGAVTAQVPPALTASMPEVPSGRLAHILQRGTLIVGVKDDYPPWGMLDGQGGHIGLEPDLAQALAVRMGVDLELVPVSASNRIGRVNQGQVDVVIATTGDTEERRKQVDVLLPNYYSSGVVVYGRKDAGRVGWEALRDAKICLNRGAFYNHVLEEDYGIEGQYFAANRDSRLALKQGRCIGWAFDDTALAQQIRAEGEAEAYQVLTEPILVSYWSILVAQGEGQGDLGRFITDMIGEWHAEGRILELQDKWGIPRSAFAEAAQATWGRVDAARAVCARDRETGAHPVACLGDAPVRSTLHPNPPGWVLTLYSATGIDIRAVVTPYNTSRLLRALWLTFALSITAILGALFLGILLSVLQVSLAGLGWIGRLLTLPQRLLITVARMTPPILQLYIVFFGLGGILGNPDGFLPGSFAIAAVILSLYAGATNTILLSHELAVETENNTPIIARLPGAVLRAYDGLVATCVNIVKAAGMASAIAVSELVSTVDLLVAEGADTTTMMNGLLIFYFLFVLGILAIFRAVRRRLVKA